MPSEPTDSIEATRSPPARRGGEMGLLEHLEEFRWTVIKSAAAIFVGMFVVGIFFPWFFDILRHPLESVADPTQTGAVLNTMKPMDVFAVIFDVTFFGGFAFALPFVIYFVARFIAPGLTERESGMLRPVIVASLILFIVGSLAGYFFILPTALKVALQLNKMLGFKTIWAASDYYSLVTWLTFGTGLVFELPLALSILMSLGIVKASWLRRYRKHAIILILIFTAILIPVPDLVTQLLIASPTYLLFEISIVVGDRLYNRRKAKNNADAANKRANEPSGT